MKKIRLISWILLGVFILMICIGSAISKRVYDREHNEANEDYDTLHYVIAEAYINVRADSNFVNTATEDEPMVIPDKYYAYQESAMGDGRAYAVIDSDGRVDAYFGSPDKNQEHYSVYGDHHRGQLSEKIYWATYWVALGFGVCFASLYGIGRYLRRREEAALESAPSDA